MKAKKPYSKRKKRVGFGIGSGHGKTSCRGQKGQRSRSGFSQRPGFEGGQNPLYRRIPKRGFNRADLQERIDVVNIESLSKMRESEITPEAMKKRGLTHQKLVKILGQGEIKKAVKVSAHFFSASAKEKIEKAGGQAIVLAAPSNKKQTAEA
jgi:large subunit ribosomal protein L15